MGAPILGAIIPSAISAISGFASQMFSNRSARKEADRMREYNTPKAQMGRFTEAGLSPYLAYSQANSGNMSSPRPEQQLGGEHLGKGIEEYMSIKNFEANQRLLQQDSWLKDQQLQSGVHSGELATLMRDRKMIEMYADFPKWLNRDISPEVGDSSFRRKLNEMKVAASKATIDRIQQAVENMQHKNVVDKVRAGYARDYGMVGGDWTQGMGLFKSIPNMFKGSAKAVKGGTPWRTTIKTNPILDMRLRRKASKGAINP